MTNTKTENIYRVCLLPDDIIKGEALKFMESSTRVSDKIIENEIRNIWGKYVQPKEEQTDAIDTIIQTAIYNFKQWNSQSKVRESILSYKCYVCNMGWWRLMSFKDHIKQHKDINVDIEPYHHECCIVAFYGVQDTTREVHIDGLCHYCLKPSREHEIIKRKCMYYTCEGCRGRFFTCASIFKHEGTCGRFQKILLLNTILTECSECPICKTNCLTKDRYEQHLYLRHSVYSDEPVSYHWPILKECIRCNLQYFQFNLHVCPKKFENVFCKHCFRKFQHRWQLDIHFAANKSTINCKICCKGIKQCNEIQHMMKHSKNYIIAYKCQRCDSNTLVPDEFSAKKHCELGHNTRFESKMKGYQCVSIFKTNNISY